MRHSRMLIPTLRDVPSEAQAVSHVLLLRGGYLRKLGAGLFALLPLGMRVVAKVERILREELARAGAEEVRLPMVPPTEALCELWRRDLKSYRQLPLDFYQIQPEPGDELQPRAGLWRGRELVAADGCSFHASDADAQRAYDRLVEVCGRIFGRCGLAVAAVEADGGARALKFRAPAESGEDAWVSCDACDYAATIDHAELRPEEAAAATAAASEPLTLVHTPGARSIAEVVAFLGGGRAAADFVKTLVYVADGQAILALVRGDRDVNERKLKAAADATALELASDAVVLAVTGADVGYAGAQGRAVPVFADYEVAALASAVAGANQTDYHVTGWNLGRDVPDARRVDLRTAGAGDVCGRCGRGRYRAQHGIEVGHAVALGPRASEPLGCTFRDSDGREKAAVMDRYGIGVTRVVAAAVEQHHDADGIRWPMALAPFQVLIVTVGNEPEPAAEAERLARELGARGVEVLYDDRDERAGAKFKDADLVGIPLRVTIGKRGLAEGRLELKARGDKEATMVPKDRIAEELVRRVQEALS